VLSVLVLGEHIAPMQVLGIVIVVAGVWCVSMTRRETLIVEEAAEVVQALGAEAEPE
jgi:drug/metabolite transporter (DMT)-like permease